MPVVNLSPSVDTYMRENAIDANYNTDTGVWVGESNGGLAAIAATLLNFSFISIPVDAIINSAILNLYLYSNYSDNARTMHVYRVIRNWTGSQATWRIAKTGTNWGIQGCSSTTTDYNNTSLGSRAFAISESLGWKTISLTPSTIKGIIDGTITPFEGFVLRMETQLNDQKRFYSSDGLYPLYLTIDYSLPGAEFQAVMIGG